MNGARATGRAVFRPRARMMSLLGEQLISDEAVGLIELVKNAYDADATQVNMELSGLRDLDAMKIVLLDNGCGMTRDDIEQKWLSPAVNHKEKQKKKRERTPRGRLPIGEKGVGRFAVQKLGRRLELVSRAAGMHEVVVRVNWDDFEREDAFLDDVEMDIEEREPVQFPGTTTGTLLVIQQGRLEWVENQVKKIQRALRRLQSPYKGKNLVDFKLSFRCPDFPTCENIESSDFLNRAHYIFEGSIDENGQLDYDYTCQHPAVRERKLVGQVIDLVPTATGLSSLKPSCGTFYVNFFVWDREPDYLKKSDVTRADLDAMIGVSLFRDGLRVLPYGEPGNDWLDLDKEKVNNSERIANQNIVGFVALEQEKTPDLRDKTDREGLIDNEAFRDMRELVRAALQVLHEQRKQDRPVKGKVVRAEPLVTRSAREAVEKARDVAKQAVTTSSQEIAHISNIQARMAVVDDSVSPPGMGDGQFRSVASTNAFPASTEVAPPIRQPRVATDSSRDLAVQNSQIGSLAYFSAQTTSTQVARQEPAGERSIGREGQLGESDADQGEVETGQGPSSLEESASGRADLLALLALLDEAVDHQYLADDLQQQERQVLYQLAATGMAAERVAHEFARHVQAAGALLHELQNASRGNGPAIRAIAGLETCLGGLRNEVRALAPYDTGFRTERTRLLPVMEPVQTAALLNQVVRAQMGITCEVLGPSFDIAGRPASLVQVFGNVLENACFWLERWSREKKIRVILNPQDRTVSIEDTGPGVAPELAERVFLPGVSMRTNGRGLGLYIAQELLETMRARIELDQSYRFGARFVISFPGSIMQSQRKGKA